jgi:hypothetical protein
MLSVTFKYTMLSITIKSIMLSIIIKCILPFCQVSYARCHFAECYYAECRGTIILSVIILIVVAPLRRGHSECYGATYIKNPMLFHPISNFIKPGPNVIKPFAAISYEFS